MIIIGELINASRKAIGAAIEAQDADAIGQVAGDQSEAGANYIDVNAGIFVGKEPQYLECLVQPMAVNNDCGMAFVDAVEQIMQRFEGIHTACGLSNISYGLPVVLAIEWIRTWKRLQDPCCSGQNCSPVPPLDIPSEKLSKRFQAKVF